MLHDLHDVRCESLSSYSLRERVWGDHKVFWGNGGGSIKGGGTINDIPVNQLLMRGGEHKNITDP